MENADNTCARRSECPDPERDPIQLAAADWVGRLSNSNVSLEDTLAWQQWMKADARHVQAFYRFEQISVALKTLDPPPAPLAWQLSRDVYDGSVPLSEWTRDTRSRSPYLITRGTFAAAATVLLAVGMAAGAVMFSDEKPWRRSSSEFATPVGENRTVKLEDGSTVTLGGDSRLKVSLTSKQRALELSRGEALFKVAKDAVRPFKVHTGDVTVVALGTEFNVRRGSDRTVVAVTEGRVVVEPVARILPVGILREFKPKLRPVHVQAGEQTTAGPAGIEGASQVEDPGATTSWKTGRLAFRLQPLDYVLEDVNRYAKKPVVVGDERIGSLVISGTVIGDNVEGWVQSLEHAFGLEAEEETGRIVLRMRHAE